VATQVLKNAYFLVNSVDLSADIESIEISLSRDLPEDTSMGDDSRSYLAGLKGATITANFNADYAASQTDATLWAIYDGDAAVAFEIRADAGAASTSNPEYGGSVHLTSYGAVGGSVGDVAKQAASFTVTGDVTRVTS
jgi:hypothetical protein